MLVHSKIRSSQVFGVTDGDVTCPVSVPFPDIYYYPRCDNLSSNVHYLQAEIILLFQSSFPPTIRTSLNTYAHTISQFAPINNPVK